MVSDEITGSEAYIKLRTKKTEFEVCTGSNIELYKNSEKVSINPEAVRKEKFVGQSFSVDVKANEEITLIKIAANLSSETIQKKHF